MEDIETDTKYRTLSLPEKDKLISKRDDSQ